METLVYVIFTIVCVFLIITVLLQPGKSGGLGAAFGGGGNTVFGASGGTPVFRRMTTIAAVCFMLLSLLLAWMSIEKSVTTDTPVQKRGLDFGAPVAVDDLPGIPMPAPAAAPVAPAPVAAPAPAPAPAAAPAPVPVPAPVEAAPAPVEAVPAPAPAPVEVAPAPVPAEPVPAVPAM